LLVSALFAAVAWTAAGLPGLAVAAAILLAWWVAGAGTRVLWPVAVLALVAAPVAIAAQGLPSAPVVGGGFGEHHPAANLLVEVALLCAAFAGLADLAGIRPPRAEGSRSHHRT
jgi:hypothetical protein